MILNPEILHNIFSGGSPHASNIMPLHAGPATDHLEYLINAEYFEITLLSGDLEIVKMSPNPSFFRDGTFSVNDKTVAVKNRFPGPAGALTTTDISVRSAYGISPLPIDVRPGFSSFNATPYHSDGGMAIRSMQSSYPTDGGYYTPLRNLWFNSIGLIGTAEKSGTISGFKIDVLDMMVYDRGFFIKALVNGSDNDTMIPIRPAGRTTALSGTVSDESGSGDLILDNVDVAAGDIIRIPNLGISFQNQSMRPRLKI